MSSNFRPNFNTPQEAQNEVEIAKRESNGMRGQIHEEFHDGDRTDIAWETEQLAKSYGIYLEFNRATQGKEKDWMYMVRLGIPGGGPIDRAQWELLDELAESHARDPEGRPSIRLTTRQNIQFHWVDKRGVLDIVKRSAGSGLFSLNGCGDNVRNVMSCPLAHGNPDFDGHALAQKLAVYFRLPSDPFIQIFAVDPAAFEAERLGEQPAEQPVEHFNYGPQLLNRKFKIGIGAVARNSVNGLLEADNCVEIRTHDLGIAPIITDGRVAFFQIYIGGGQGEKIGKPTAAMLGLPLAVVSADQILPVVDAVVAVHQDWGDRQNRHWARLKYVVRAMGIDWFRERVEERTGFALADPEPTLDPGARHLHHGFIREVCGGDSSLSFGAFIENGRISDFGPNGRLKSLVRYLSDTYPVRLMITPNQDLLFRGLPEAAATQFERDLAQFGFGTRHGLPYSNLRRHSGACVGRDTCRLAYTDSEKFEPELVDELEAHGWGYLSESIGITGCERQCFRPSTKTIGLVGSGLNRYQIRLFGSEDGRFQGVPLGDGERIYLGSIPRDRVAQVLDTLFRFYQTGHRVGESMGAFLRRTGAESLIAQLKSHPATMDLMEKTQPDRRLASEGTNPAEPVRSEMSRISV